MNLRSSATTPKSASGSSSAENVNASVDQNEADASMDVDVDTDTDTVLDEVAKRLADELSGLWSENQNGDGDASNRATRASSITSVNTQAGNAQDPVAGTSSGSDSKSWRDQEEKEWVVEKILDKCRYQGKIWYQLKWENWEDPTWEPEENLTNCKKMMETFNKKWEQEKRKIEDWVSDSEDEEGETESKKMKTESKTTKT